MQKENRQLVAFEMRENKNTFQEIGDKLGVTRERARQLYCKELREQRASKEWCYGLSVRVLNIINNHGISNKEELTQAIKTGVLSPKGKSIRNSSEFRARGFGVVLYREVCNWIGYDSPYLAKKGLRKMTDLKKLTALFNEWGLKYEIDPLKIDGGDRTHIGVRGLHLTSSYSYFFFKSDESFDHHEVGEIQAT